jgi:GTP pyrophosphokinase
LGDPLSKSQIDRLGERLRRGDPSSDDLKSLDAYRRSFGDALDVVIRTIGEELGVTATGRSAKSTGSVIEKLRRESVRLSQMQDIAGCRVKVDDIPDQDAMVSSLCTLFPNSVVVDRRKLPSHGYRAVHVIVDAAGRHVEIQVRTWLQQLWAEMSEKLADNEGVSVKYGGGDATVRELLAEASGIVLEFESSKYDPVTRIQQRDQIAGLIRDMIEALGQDS